jgi:hypothetical protein
MEKRICAKLKSCEKINTILDKDMLEFQYVDCIKQVCKECDSFQKKQSSFICEVCGKPYDRDGGHYCGGFQDSVIHCPYCKKTIKIGVA